MAKSSAGILNSVSSFRIHKWHFQDERAEFTIWNLSEKMLEIHNLKKMLMYYNINKSKWVSE